jgi:ATP-binding cassette, subfamily B, bacterial HlyB/CyaB
VNRLKGRVTVLFIAHQVPKGLAVDDVLTLGAERAMQMRVVEEAQTT